MKFLHKNEFLPLRLCSFAPLRETKTVIYLPKNSYKKGALRTHPTKD